MRFLIFRIFIYLGLILLGLGLFQTQVIEGPHYRRLSEQNRIRLIPLEAPRGRVYDSKGKLLATNRPSYDIMATPEDVTPEVYPKLAKILDLPEGEIRKRMRNAREYPFTPAMIQEDVSKEQVFVIEEHRPDLPGVFVNIASIRYYPYGQTASHIIGYIGKINQEEYDQLDRQRYGMNSLIGRSGLEKTFDETLRGWRGGRQIEVNARGQMIRVISDRDPEPGEDLKLSVDLEFQNKVMELLKDKRAAVAVLDLKTGGLIALASAPAFDPNAFVSPSRGAERLGLLKDKNFPLLNRATGSAYPPGSVFKLVTALSALEKGKITANTTFTCTGRFRLKPHSRPYACWNKQGHGTLGLYEAIERSCNVYFYNVGARLSPDAIAHYARELGLGVPPALELTHVTPGLVPDTQWKSAKLHQKWYQGETLSFAIGQSYLLTSPLQILRMVSIIAKNGEWVEPRLVVSREENLQAPAIPKKIAIHEENIKVIKRGMLQVVQSHFGTGQLAKVDFAKLAAKTGTAQVPPSMSHAWMTGFFPYEDPQIAFVVFVEHGGSGGIAAGHIVKDMLQIWKEKENVSQVA
jgi:penicillin-binding protein 2